MNEYLFSTRTFLLGTLPMTSQENPSSPDRYSSYPSTSISCSVIHSISIDRSFNETSNSINSNGNGFSMILYTYKNCPASDTMYKKLFAYSIAMPSSLPRGSPPRVPSLVIGNVSITDPLVLHLYTIDSISLPSHKNPVSSTKYDAE